MATFVACSARACSLIYLVFVLLSSRKHNLRIKQPRIMGTNCAHWPQQGCLNELHRYQGPSLLQKVF